MQDRIVTAIFAVTVASLLLYFLNAWLAFGLAACALLTLGLGLGFGGGRRITRALLALFAGYSVLLGGMVWLAETPALVLGFPAPTALLVYGIWPMPLLMGLLYALVFHSSVLPEEKLKKFLAEHGSRRSRREPESR